MTATLSAELEGRVPADLVADIVADIVRTVLDESRQAAHDWGVQPTMIEARQRLERLIRAGSSRLNQSNDCPGMGLDKTELPRPVH